MVRATGNFAARFATAGLWLALLGVACSGATTVPGVCNETGTRLPDQTFIDAAVSITAVGDRQIVARGNDGKYKPFAYSLWPSADAYIAEHPECCQIYKGPAADWFTPLDENPELAGQEGRVVRINRPRLSIESEKITIGYGTSYLVFDDCAKIVED